MVYRGAFVQHPTNGVPYPTYFPEGIDIDTCRRFDWHLLNSLDLDRAISHEDVERVLFSFADSEFGPAERQFFPFPLSQKFYTVLQFCVNNLLDSQRKLQNEVTGLRSRLKKLDSQLQSFTTKQTSYQPSQATTIAYACPTCQKLFITPQHLDKHILRRHRHLYEAWCGLKNGYIPNKQNEIKELTQQLTELKRTIKDYRSLDTHLGLEYEQPEGKITTFYSKSPESTERMFDFEDSP